MPTIVGITGGPGTGKSTAVRIFQQLGILELIDADLIGKQIVEPGKPALKKLVEHFGKDILNEDGTLNRKKMSLIVFSDESARQKLNEIVHPPLWEEVKQRIERWKNIKSQNNDGIVLVEAALLFEAKIESYMDKIIVIVADREIQIKRLLAKGLTEKEANGRIDSQMSSEEKAKRADYVIENNGSVEDLNEKVKDVYCKIVHNV